MKAFFSRAAKKSSVLLFLTFFLRLVETKFRLMRLLYCEIRLNKKSNSESSREEAYYEKK